MRSPPLTSSRGQARLSLRQMRTIESEMGVFIEAPLHPRRSPNQQVGIYDENEQHLGDLMATGPSFNVQELIDQIRALLHARPSR